MVTVNDVDLKQIVLSNTSFGPREIDQINAAIAADFSRYQTLRNATVELENNGDRTPAAAVRLGVCYYLLGRYSAAITTFSAADGGGWPTIISASRTLPSSTTAKLWMVITRRCRPATTRTPASCRSPRRCGIGATQRGRRPGSMRLRRGRADCGISLSTRRDGGGVRGNPSEVVALYERAVEVDPNHPGLVRPGPGE